MTKMKNKHATLHSAARLQRVVFNKISPRAKKVMNLRLPFCVDVLHWSVLILSSKFTNA